ncbi:hypothetical protein JW935_04875 [candidate division KSB1 bacterium]|nr:hypothetical protein [candidate division KSB1 bacterium]
MQKVLMTFTAVVCFLGTAPAEVTSKISGVAYGDYYYNLQNHDNQNKDRNAFEFRRLYFTFENNLSADIKIRFRLEAKHEEYGQKSALNPFVKHAFLEWSNLIPAHKLYLGIAETNAFKNAESIWGYRSIEKTIMDLNKISSSADMGIGLKGDLGKYLHHWLTIMNGTGYSSPEADRYKRFGYALWVTPVKGLTIEGYVDYENLDSQEPQTGRATHKNYSGAKGYYTYKAMVAYEQPTWSIGAEYFAQTDKKSGISNPEIENGALVNYDKSDVTHTGYSVFGSWITPVPKLKAFARYDYYDVNAENNVYTAFSDGVLTGGTDDETTLMIAGLDYIPSANVHFMPNIFITGYGSKDTKSDITARITMYYKFDSGKIITQ